MQSDSAGPDRTIHSDERIGRFVDALTLGATIPEAGEVVGLARSQAYEWARRVEVRDELADRRAEMRRMVVHTAADAALVALATLQSICADPASKPTDRLRAASTILDHALAGWEWSLHEDVVELTERVRTVAA